MSTLTLVRNTVCQKLITEFDAVLKLLAIVKAAVYGPINTIKTTLQTMQYAAIGAINSAVEDINNNIDDIVPDIDDAAIREILNIIRNCPFLCEDLNFKNPVTLLRSIESETKNLAASTINSLTSGLYEFSAAQLIDSMIHKYGPKGFNLTTKIPKIYQIIDCVDALCDDDISSRVTAFNNYLVQLYILSDGNFDRYRLYTDINMSPSQKLNIETALDSLLGIVEDIDSSLDSGVDYAKSLNLDPPPCA
jgi:hypothetical protein